MPAPFKGKTGDNIDVQLAGTVHVFDPAGPRIATDRPLRPRSPVHYRYGAFRSPPQPHDAGEPRDALPALRDPEGRLLADRRERAYVAPAGVADPFERAQTDAGDYARWRVERMFILVPAQAYVGQHLKTYEEYPPRQKPGSFSLDQVLAKLQEAGAGKR